MFAYRPATTCRRTGRWASASRFCSEIRVGDADTPPAAVRALPSPPCSVYHSLSIVPVGTLTSPGGDGPPASGLPPPQRRAYGAPPGHRQAPRGLPAHGGGGRRRRELAAVRRVRIPRVPDVRCLRTLRGAVSVRGLRARAPATLFVQGTGVVSELRGPADDGARRRPDDAVLPWVRCGSGSSRCRIGSGTRWRGKAPRSLAGSPTVRGSS